MSIYTPETLVLDNKLMRVNNEPLKLIAMHGKLDVECKLDARCEIIRRIINFRCLEYLGAHPFKTARSQFSPFTRFPDLGYQLWLNARGISHESPRWLS